MKRIVKVPECEGLTLENKTFGEPVKVQGGTKAEYENFLHIVSGGRYKLFTEKCDYVRVLEGAGHFKWARGEISFAQGDIFLVEEAGEYELNGKGEYLILRK